MARRYRSVRVSLEAYNNLMKKKKEMDSEARKIAQRFKGRIKIKPIHLTNILDTIVRKPIYIDDETLMRKAGVRKIK